MAELSESHDTMPARGSDDGAASPDRVRGLIVDVTSNGIAYRQCCCELIDLYDDWCDRFVPLLAVAAVGGDGQIASASTVERNDAAGGNARVSRGCPRIELEAADADDGDVKAVRERLGDAHADAERRITTRADIDKDGFDVGLRATGFGQQSIDIWEQLDAVVAVGLPRKCEACHAVNGEREAWCVVGCIDTQLQFGAFYSAQRRGGCRGWIDGVGEAPYPTDEVWDIEVDQQSQWKSG